VQLFNGTKPDAVEAAHDDVPDPVRVIPAHPGRIVANRVNQVKNRDK
jgi:hypothetical protein